MTTNHAVHRAVTSFLEALAKANAVDADSPLLSEWEVLPATGDADNEVVVFKWEDGDGTYQVRLTEGLIAAGQWKGKSFFCVDQDGHDVQITLYQHVAVAPTCKQCGSHVMEEYCTDQTCPFSDWPQAVEREDLNVFATDEVEAKYGITKRVAVGA